MNRHDSDLENVYHEKQIKELCALHALNNLFQDAKFTKVELDSICLSLAPDVWINPHRSVLGIGNYDVNVIMAALNKHGYEAIWFDKRKNANCLNLEAIEGFILNVPTPCQLGIIRLPLKIKHWIAVRKIKRNYYNLDSKLDHPKLIGQDADLVKYFQEELDSKEKEMFIVVSRENATNQRWFTGSADVSKTNQESSSASSLSVTLKNEETR